MLLRLRNLLLSVLLITPAVWADTSTSTSTLTVDPAATSGATITASDENNRNNDVTTWANAHVHSLSNTTNFGDGTAGNKNLCADAANSTDSCIRFNDTAKLWTVDNPTAGSFNQVATVSGTAGLIANSVLSGNGTGSITTLTSSAPADDKALIGDSSTAATWQTVPNCTDSSGNHLNYTQSSNSFSCGTSSSYTPANIQTCSCSTSSCSCTATCTANTLIVSAQQRTASATCTAATAFNSASFDNMLSCYGATSCTSDASSGSAACVRIACVD